MRKTGLTIIAGLALGGLLIIVLLAIQKPVILASAANPNGLMPGAQVRLEEKPIGRIKSITTPKDGPPSLVIISLENPLRIPQDSYFQAEIATITGLKELILIPGLSKKSYTSPARLEIQEKTYKLQESP